MGLEQALPWLILAFAVGYVIGSIPMGVLIARLFKLGDLRKVGSGNIGATNVLRTGSKKAAALTLLLDAAKGAVPVLVFLQWGDLAAQAAGLGAVIGHCFPVWLKFRGGKGVATYIGVIFALYWPVGLMICANWSMAARLSKISSVGGLVATAAAPIWLAIFGRWEAVLVTLILAALVWARHHENIRRLIAGTEPKIGGAK
ncbi:glycerol-3-phosphate 1-O-acyltransferase PlsY [Rhodobacteraceae bacterium NNCM2]|nr:glycerol-3-phosphate 1-O-acyltransferase PlsY [Coraliihabitans acroporae]